MRGAVAWVPPGQEVISGIAVYPWRAPNLAQAWLTAGTSASPPIPMAETPAQGTACSRAHIWLQNPPQHMFQAAWPADWSWYLDQVSLGFLPFRMQFSHQPQTCTFLCPGDASKAEGGCCG